MKLVFMHGSGMNSTVWKQQLDYFGSAEAIDLPGHPNGKLAESMEDYLNFVLEYLDQQNDEVVLVGHSLGSAVAMVAGISGHPSLKALVLIGAGARLKVMPALLEELAQRVAGDKKIPEMIFAMNKGLAEPLRSEVNEGMMSNGAEVLLKDLSICNEFDVMDQLAKVSIPCLVLVGEQDVMTPPKYAEYLIAQLPNATIQVFDKGSHMVFAEQAEKVNAEIDRFVSCL